MWHALNSSSVTIVQWHDTRVCSVLSLGCLQIGSSMREGMLLGIVEHLLGIDADIKWQEIVDVPSGEQEEQLPSPSLTHTLSLSSLPLSQTPPPLLLLQYNYRAFWSLSVG